ncbi:MAG TPA: hypothetical protein VLB90_08435 [Pseudomonadales bacterium]|nr:hypothetical protein [Pseudomonadales bacterium]
MMLFLWLSLLFMPVSAALSGLGVWLLAGGEQQEDRELFRNFICLLAVFMLLYWGTVNTDSVRMYTDPQFRAQTEMDANPIYNAFKDFSPDDHRTLHEFLILRMSQGATLSEAFLQARPLLDQMANNRLGFADQKSRVEWGKVTADTLRELQTVDPELCYRVLSSQPLDSQTLARVFSVANTEAFQQAVAHVYESAGRGIRHERTPGDTPVEFNAAAREFHTISDSIAKQFGEPVAEQVARKVFPEQPTEPPAPLCAARIAQLDAMLERPQAMAAMLIDSALR